MSGIRQRTVVDGRDTVAVVTAAGLDVDGRLIDWTDVDGLDEGDHRLTISMADRTTVTLGALGATADRFVDEVRAARRATRFPALAMATGQPLDTYVSRSSDGIADIHLFRSAVIVEPRSGAPRQVPLPLVRRVERDGHRITVQCNHLAPLVLGGLGGRTDEFHRELETLGTRLRGATAAAYAEFEPALSGLPAPDGWALSADDDPGAWRVLRTRAGSASRADELEVLAGLAGDRLRIGLFTDGGTRTLPFALAQVGQRVVLEAFDADDHATFVFDTADTDQVNALLLCIGFRREPIALAADQLGGWAAAVRTRSEVADLRRLLTARVVHDSRWAEAVRAAVSG